jgi:hypothetical protein
MRFSDNGYYIERYVKCDNCGVLIYDEGLKAETKEGPKLYCSNWCTEWAKMRMAGVENPRLPLPKEGIHKVG